ncbi:MAG TPA: hypothetical protein VK498_00800 [Ferruginibacter sp.]|nr:hypothetical protein [Ferruginibacter sp.]
MKKIPVLLIVTLIIFSACKKSSEEFNSAAIQDYYPLAVGKYITYNLDSIVTINFGASMVVRKYQVKYQVDALITDNLGRPAYRIVRSIRNTAANPWQSDATFMAINTSNSLEFVENNLRYIKLKVPIKDGYSWKGNAYIDTYSLNSELKYLDSWDYVYDSVNVRSTVGTFTLDSTLKVNQRDEIIGSPSDPNSYSEKNYGVEKYAAGIGLVYRNFLHTEYQPPVPGLGGHFVTGSYGVILTMIDHN